MLAFRLHVLSHHSCCHHIISHSEQVQTLASLSSVFSVPWIASPKTKLIKKRAEWFSWAFSAQCCPRTSEAPYLDSQEFFHLSLAFLLKTKPPPYSQGEAWELEQVIGKTD